jgi:acyl-CoA synthetase (AMP-forming)/AMP-acid ligase II
MAHLLLPRVALPAILPLWTKSAKYSSLTVFIVDRKEDMINTAGFKVFPAEIGHVVAAHDAGAMAAVGSQLDEIKGVRHGNVPGPHPRLTPEAPAFGSEDYSKQAGDAAPPKPWCSRDGPDVDLFGNCERVVNFNAKTAHCAFDF